MTKQTSKHQKNKKPVCYDSDGLCLTEMLELAEDHEHVFKIVHWILMHDKNERLDKYAKWIIKIIRWII